MVEDKSYIGSAIIALIGLGMYLCFISKRYKVLEETENKFIFQIRPTISWAIGVFFGSIAFLFILSTLFFPPVTILTCKYFPESYVDRQYPSCQLVAISWIGTAQNKTLIPELQAALLVADSTTDINVSKFNLYRIVLIANENNIFFRENYVYKSTPEYKNLLTIASQINSFITKPLRNTLKVEQDGKIIGYAGFGICAFFSLITFLILTVSPYVTCSFERELEIVTIKRRNLFGNKVLEDKISNIVGVEVETRSGEDITFRLTLMLASGEKLPLTYFFTSEGWQEEQLFANRIQKFLGIAQNATVHHTT
jgi:hypothetical protein